MTDEGQELPPRVPTRSRAEERKNTKIGAAIAAVGAGIVLIPLLRNGELPMIPAVAGVVLVAIGCTMAEPATFRPLLSEALGRLSFPFGRKDS